MKVLTQPNPILVCFAIIGFTRPAFAQDAPATQADTKLKGQKTVWRIEPSFKFDTLCLLNTLTGDPF